MSKFRITTYKNGVGEKHYTLEVHEGFIIGFRNVSRHGYSSDYTEKIRSLEEVYSAIEKYDNKKVKKVETKIVHT